MWCKPIQGHLIIPNSPKVFYSLYILLVCAQNPVRLRTVIAPCVHLNHCLKFLATCQPHGPPPSPPRTLASEYKIQKPRVHLILFASVLWLHDDGDDVVNYTASYTVFLSLSLSLCRIFGLIPTTPHLTPIFSSLFTSTPIPFGEEKTCVCVCTKANNSTNQLYTII